MWFLLVNRMSLRPGLLWLTLNLRMILQPPEKSFAYRLKRLRLPPGRGGGKSTPGWRPLYCADLTSRICLSVLFRDATSKELKSPLCQISYATKTCGDVDV
jgi:hypothetical protein